MHKIAEHYIKKIATSDKFFSINRVNDTDLLYPPFYEKVLRSFEQYKKRYPLSLPEIFETYRSDSLQLKYFNQGASKIRKAGMHGFGIAADITFRISGKVTWHGDYKTLRQIHVENGMFLIAKNDDGHVQEIKVNIIIQQNLRNEVYKQVKAFQRTHGLQVDGVIGSKTISKLKEIYLT